VEVKAAAKVAKQEERDAHIRHVTEFERKAMANEDFMDAAPWLNLTLKRSTCGNHLDSEGLVSDGMDNEDLTDSTLWPNFATKCSTGLNSDIETSEVDRPNPDGDTYVPPDESADDLESDDLAETIDATPIPASKRKKNAAPAAATKQMKPNAAGKLNLKASKQLADIVENPESDEEPLVLKKGHGSRKKTPMIVEDSENSDRDLPPTKKSRFSDGTKQEVKSTQQGKKESIHEAISAIHQGQKVATTDTNNGGMGDSEVGDERERESVSGYSKIMYC